MYLFMLNHPAAVIAIVVAFAVAFFAVVVCSCGLLWPAEPACPRCDGPVDRELRCIDHACEQARTKGLH